MKIKLLGDTAIIIYYENPDNSCSFAKVQTDYALLRNSGLAGIRDIELALLKPVDRVKFIPQ